MKAAIYSCVAGIAIATPPPDVLSKFEDFRTKWNRAYDREEYMKRAQYFEDHLHQVEYFQRHELGTAMYSYLGPFADLSPEELQQRFGLLPPELSEEIPAAPLLNKTLASSFDWVSKGAVNPIKDQGQCGSCWAFSAACNLEGTAFVNTGKLVSVSEQNLVDCDKSSSGCKGGWPYKALMWSARCIASEASYQYTARDGFCRIAKKIARNIAYRKISRNENQIAQALTSYGPLSICVDAAPYHGYKSGVLKNPKCSQTKLTHAVNIVGYGSQGLLPYWKVRNSWGTDWGEAGYMQMYRGNCQCGLCTEVISATGTTILNAPTPSPSPGPSPKPPTPSPSPGPSPKPVCQDRVPTCPKNGLWCTAVWKWCEKSCGCCSANPPKYCRGSDSTGKLDELLNVTIV